MKVLTRQQLERMLEEYAAFHDSTKVTRLGEPEATGATPTADRDAAWEARVKRCAEHLKAGWPIEDCLIFVYTREELRDALARAGRLAA